jgi:hypothetical protein
MILQGLKPRIFTQDGEDVHARLNTRAGKWAAEVPLVLWSLQTMPNWLIGFTPFFMVYGTEAVLPTDLKYGSPQGSSLSIDTTKEAQKDAINLLKESRDTVLVRLARYQ